MEIKEKEKKFLTVNELAARWQVPTHWVYSNHKTKGIPKMNLGQGLRFPLEQLEEWEASHTSF